MWIVLVMLLPCRTNDWIHVPLYPDNREYVHKVTGCLRSHYNFNVSSSGAAWHVGGGSRDRRLTRPTPSSAGSRDSAFRTATRTLLFVLLYATRRERSPIIIIRIILERKKYTRRNHQDILIITFTRLLYIVVVVVVVVVVFVSIGVHLSHLLRCGICRVHWFADYCRSLDLLLYSVAQYRNVTYRGTSLRRAEREHEAEVAPLGPPRRLLAHPGWAFEGFRTPQKNKQTNKPTTLNLCSC